MEEKINEYLNTHSEVDGIFTEDVEAYFCLVQAKKRGISIPRDLKIVGSTVFNRERIKRKREDIRK